MPRAGHNRDVNLGRREPAPELPPPLLFEGKRYQIHHAYDWKDLPSVNRQDAREQSADFEAHYGRPYRHLSYELIMVPNEELVAMLERRLGPAYERMAHTPEIKKLMDLIGRHGLRFPPLVDEGWKRAIAVAKLGWDMPYWRVVEPLEFEADPIGIPTLDGRRRAR